MKELLQRAKNAKGAVAALTSEEKNNALTAMAQGLLSHQE